MSILHSRFADINGDGTGLKNAVGNYSDGGLGLTEFKISPGAGEIFQLRRLIIFIKDTGLLHADFYGVNVVLTNGITIKHTRDTPTGPLTTIWDITDGVPIMKNPHWKRLCHDEIPSLYGGGGDDSVTYRYTFDRDGKPLILNGDNNDQLIITLNDDFSALVEHCFRVGMIKL